MKFGKYLEQCLKKRNISLNSAANELGLNRGDLYHIIEGKRKLKHESFSRLVAVVPFSEEEENKLIDLYFSEFYGNREYEKIKYICKRLENINEAFEVYDDYVNDFEKHFELKSEDEILSAILYICENSKSRKAVTNYSYTSARIDSLFYRLCLEEKIEDFCHILSFNSVSSDKYNFELLFSSLKFIYKKKFPYYYYSELNGEDKTAYSYYCLTEYGAVLFNENSGIFIESEQVVAELNKRIERLMRSCNRLGAEMPDIFAQKDFYVAAVTGAKEILEFSARPCIMSFVDLDFFYSICKKELANRDFLIQMANEHYSNINKHVSYKQFITVEGLDILFKYRECPEMPEEYANPIPKETLKRIFEKMYDAAKEGRLNIVNTEKLKVPFEFQLEITPAGAVVYGYEFEEGKPTEKIFLLTIKDKAMNQTLKCFVDYLERANLIFTKQTTLAYLSNRIVAFDY